MSQYRATAMPMRVQVRPGSAAERGYLRSARRGPAWPRTRSIAAGIDPEPQEDLVFHGGKVVPQMEFQNVYLGGAESWTARDVDFIDSAIQRAMQHRRLNNVLTPYFPAARASCDMRPSFVVDEAKPKRLDESDVQARVVALYDAGLLRKTQLDTCIFNLVLPAGAVLTTATQVTIAAPFQGAELDAEFRFAFLPGAVSGVIFRDDNMSGDFESAEDTPAAGVPVALLAGAARVVQRLLDRRLQRVQALLGVEQLGVGAVALGLQVGELAQQRLLLRLQRLVLRRQHAAARKGLVPAERGDQRQRLPVAVRYTGDEALAARLQPRIVALKSGAVVS